MIILGTLNEDAIDVRVYETWTGSRVAKTTLDVRAGAELIRARNALVAAGFIAGLEKDADGRFRVCLQGCDEPLEISRRHIARVRQLVKALQS